MSLDIWLKVEVDTGGKEMFSSEIGSWNYTHNVTGMWSKAGCYKALYMSEGQTADDVLQELEAGLRRMKENPEEYEAINPSNGWGSYETAVSWLEGLIEVFREHPKAIIGISK